MNVDLRIINARVNKIQGDCKNVSSSFCQNEEFRKLEIARVDTAIQTLRDQHLGQDLPDLSALQSSWELFKANISQVDRLEDIKNRILSLETILAPRVPQGVSLTAAAEDPDVQAAEDLDEEEKAERLEAQKDLLPKHKPNLFKEIRSLARNIVDRKYGDIIKIACLGNDPSIVYKDAFLRLLLIEKSLSEPAIHTQHEIEWDLSEEAFERLKELQEEMKKIDPKERISLLQKISNPEEEVPLTQNEKKLFDTLNEAIHLIKITKDEELIYPQLLCERAEEIEKVSESYRQARKLLSNRPPKPLKQGESLAKEIFKLRSADPEGFFNAIDRVLQDILQIKERSDFPKVNSLIKKIMRCLNEELQKTPEIMKSFPKRGFLWDYFYNHMHRKEFSVNFSNVRFSMLMIPKLFENEHAFALQLTIQLVKFIKELKESNQYFNMPFEFIQKVNEHQPQIAKELICCLSSRERVEFFIQQIYAAKELGQEVEIPELLRLCRFEAQMFIKEILFDYWNDISDQGLSKESADLAKIQIRQFLAYFRSELKEFFPGQSSEQIEFDLLFICLSTEQLPLLLIPELVRIGKKETALDIARVVVEKVKTSSDTQTRDLSYPLLYALLKSTGLKWGLLDEQTLGPLVESESVSDHPLDTEFTALYLEHMRSLQDPENYIGSVIDLARSLDPRATQVSDDSYRKFSLEVTDLLKDMLPKAFEISCLSSDLLRKVTTLCRLVVGFSLVGPIDKVIPMAESALAAINPDSFPLEKFSPMLNMLASYLITSIKIVHKKQESDAGEMKSLKTSLVELLFDTINRMPNVEDRINALFQIPEHLEVEFYEDDDFYVELSLSAMNQTLTEILNWDTVGESIGNKIHTLEELLEMAEPFSQGLADLINLQIEVAKTDLMEYRGIQDELREFETSKDLDLVQTIERCIDLIERGQEPNTFNRILVIYQNLIGQVANTEQERLRKSMEDTLSNWDKTLPEEED